MSFHAGQTFTFGEQPSATKWQYLWDNDYALADGTGISDDAIIARHISGFDKSNLTTDSNPYKFSVYPSATVGISSATQKIALNTEVFDTNNNFDSTTNYRYTAPVSGFYFVSGQARLGSAGMGTTESSSIGIYKNGSQLLVSTFDNGSGAATKLTTPYIGRLIQLTASDYIELYALMGGVYRDIVAGPVVTHFTGFLVSRT